MSNKPDTTTWFDGVELLDSFDDDRDLANSILEDALQEIPEDIEKLKELAAGNDTQAILHQAHMMKGVAANICAAALRKVCFEIETAAKDGDVESARALLPELEQAGLMTLDAISKGL